MTGESTRDRLASVGGREIALGQVDVRIDVRAALGAHPLSPPTEPNSWATRNGLAWLWLGPDEWLVLSDDPRAVPAITMRLERALADVHHSVVDVSAARVVFELATDRRTDLLAEGCGLDLHPRAWREGRCAQTLLARVPVVLQELAASTRVFVRPSLAGYLASWLGAVSG